MSDELKPCPFCGGEASIAWKGGVHSTRKIIVKCGGCRYQRTDAALRYGDEWLLDVAVTAWNARAAESASQAAAPSAPYSIDADPDGIRERVADAITGALSFGAQGTHKPPAGHWLEPFWDIARAEREATVPPTVDEATARRLDDYLGGEFDIRIGKQAAHAALVHALAQDRASQAGAAGVPDGWQPIETAPKDGREVVLAVKRRAGISHGVLIGHYMGGGHCIEDHPPIGAGWYFWNGRMFDEASVPTHWRPMPHHPEWEPGGWQSTKQGAAPAPAAEREVRRG